mmetsp:Transcript_21659/g.53027  ORF Transcript_21659/g.53027 Transcript_21659/m.53027 type:complete len:842 (-) Transcript_21659:297-2822(-)
MGFLTKGKPLSWKESESVREYVRKHGIEQFLSIWKQNKDREDLDFLWGDEVEGFLVKTEEKGGAKSIKLSLRGSKILEALEQDEEKKMAQEKDGCATCPPSVIFHPEYGRFMIETTPSGPYGGYTRDLRCVEANMRLRRKKIAHFLEKGEIYSTLTIYPLMGDGTFTAPAKKPNGPVAKSDYVPDDLINPHPRFATLTANIRTRRGSKVDIRVPLFKDLKTPKELGDEILMDAMAFGMGSCCLQVTFLARNLTEARNLYDHLAVLGPILLSLTAATPFYKGKVADTDVRWSVISQSVDDRTPEERGLVSTAPEKAIQKSRYDSISSFIGDGKKGFFKEKYNDIKLETNEAAYKRLVGEGVDEVLAQHIAHLWIRDPLVIYQQRIELDDSKDVDHFENIQSTNWQSVRFKPPPSKEIGWRVEFRTMEVQLTDFENAAFTVFIALVSRAILAFSLNLYIPISKVDENMETAHRRGSVLKEKFHWRKSVGEGVIDTLSRASSMVDFKKAAEARSGQEAVNATGAKASGYMRSVIRIDETQYRKDTLDNFLRVPAKHKFVLVVGAEKDGKSWCPGCARALPLVEAKLNSFKDNAALLVLTVEREGYKGNKQHPYRLEERLQANAIPCLVRVDPQGGGFFSRCLDPKWATDQFCVNRYMSRKPARRLRGGSNQFSRDMSFESDTVVETTIEDIMLGDGEDGPLGLIPIVHKYLDMIECDPESRSVVNRYLSMIADRASGKLMTSATWLRRFLDLHPDYKKDSCLNESIVHDILKTCDGITDGSLGAPQLLGEYANTCENKFTDRDGEVITVSAATGKVDLAAAKEQGKVFVAARSPRNRTRNLSKK